MKKSIVGIVAVAAVCAALSAFSHVRAGSAPAGQAGYTTLRWAGRENTHIVHPDGTTEFLGAKFAGIKKPEHADDRSFYMNLAMNGLSREGYELVAMTPDDYVFRRVVFPK